MFKIQGKYNTAKIFTDNVENAVTTQIYNMLNLEFIKGSKICIMPDVHSGKGCMVGITLTITDKIVPEWLGVDIGCGMETAKLKETNIDLSKLDEAIHRYIPAGFNIRKVSHSHADKLDLNQLRCAKHMDLGRALKSVGTLGGGNHFIELSKSDDENGALWLVVHSGSRGLGNQAAEYYQTKAAKYTREKRVGNSSVGYLDGKLFDDYVHDVAILQQYASLNRKTIIAELEKQVGFRVVESFATVHNFIDMEKMIMRKGAISAKEGEKVIIPMNMRDGSLLCVGKGNPDWNYSAPHGAGRLMSRTEARSKISLSEFEEAMEGIYSSTVGKKTLDEAPFAYKPMEEIISHIGDTVDIITTLRPLYNFKSLK